MQFSNVRKMILMAGWITAIIFSTSTYASTDPLPSWNEGATKKAILDFVKATTDKTDSHYIEPTKRFVTFDQDGTLWVEQPVYTQVIFAMDRIVALAPQHPEWKNTAPFKYLIEKNKAAMAKFTTQDLEKIMVVTHSGMSVEQYQATVKDWLATAKDSRWHRPYTELVYQPMLELMHFLRDNGYKIYIVTGGGQDFVRTFAEKVYGIPAEQIIGSALQTQCTFDKNGNIVLMKVPKLLLNNNNAGKPENIYLFIGHHPQIAVGNSTGDQQMLEYTQANKQASLMLLLHHDDAAREYQYDTQSKVGTFSAALMAEAVKRGWYVVSMKNDWKRVFSF